MAGNYIVSSYADPATGQQKYRVIGVNGEDAGSAVAILTNKDVANQLAQKSVITTQDTQQAQLQDINYQGGVQTTETSPSSTASYGTAPSSSIPPGQVKVYGDTTTTISVPTSSAIPEGQVKVYSDTTTSAVTPSLQEQINAVAKAEGINYTTVKDIDYNRNSNGTFTGSDGQIYISQGDNFVLAGSVADRSPAAVSSAVDPEASLSAGETIVPDSEVNKSATPVNGGTAALGAAYDDNGFLMPGYSLDEENNPVFVGNDFVEPATAESAQSSRVAAAKLNAQAQQTRSTQAGQIQNGDWRVRLSLASGSQYLYNDPGLTSPASGILYPLRQTNGVIFPYTPSIQTAYRATYSPYDPTHSNFRGYFYQNSFVDAIQINATFTAQDTSEANYLLAVMHFFKSATKMFYGQDAQRGSPPPMCFLSGLGDYQYNNHPVLIQSFNYTLPADVDYIRAGAPNQVGLNLSSIRDRQSVATNSLFGAAQRLAAAFTTKGAIPNQPAPPTLGLNRPTYVPTKIDLSLTLLPVQSRQQASKQFSVKEFANGNLLKKGFW